MSMPELNKDSTKLLTESMIKHHLISRIDEIAKRNQVMLYHGRDVSYSLYLHIQVITFFIHGRDVSYSLFRNTYLEGSGEIYE